jgi:diphthamide biosynthesis protein 3
MQMKCQARTPRRRHDSSVSTSTSFLLVLTLRTPPSQRMRNPRANMSSTNTQTEETQSRPTTVTTLTGETSKDPSASSNAPAQQDDDTEVYDEIEIEDMTYDSTLQIYHYPCPCGDRFEINIDSLRDGEDIAVCPGCSLTIRVIFDIEDLPEKE